MNRRHLLCTTGLGLVGGAMARAGVLPALSSNAKNQAKALSLADYEPKSMLQVRETHVERARFPVIDIHTHISVSAKSKDGVELVPERQYLGTPEELLAVMDRKNIRGRGTGGGPKRGGGGDRRARADRLPARSGCPDARRPGVRRWSVAACQPGPATRRTGLGVDGRPRPGDSRRRAGRRSQRHGPPSARPRRPAQRRPLIGRSRHPFRPDSLTRIPAAEDAEGTALSQFRTTLP